MSTDHRLTRLLARLDRLEAENARLTAQVQQLSTDQTVDRRGLLKRAGAIALGATAVGIAGQAIDPPKAAAADGSALILGRHDNTSTNTTQYRANVVDWAALFVRNEGSGSGEFQRTMAIGAEATNVGVRGQGWTRAGVLGTFGLVGDAPRDLRAGVIGYASQESASGVIGANQVGTGVDGRGSRSGHGVMGRTDGSGNGVRGEATGAGAGVAGFARGTGSGVYGETGSQNAGVFGYNTNGRAVEGFDEAGGIGVYGHTHLDDYDNLGVGVLGISHGHSGQPQDRNGGVIGNSSMAIGVQGLSDDRDGVVGRSSYARGGWFAGGAAAVRLVPGSSATRPTAGETGDLYVDSTGRLWYCKQGGGTASWVNLA